MLKVGDTVQFVVPDKQYQWYTDWFGEMVRAGETGKIVSCEPSRYKVRPINKDTLCPFNEFTTDSCTVRGLNLFHKF